MSSTTAIALSGMNAAQTALQAAAHHIANLGTAGSRRDRLVQSSSATGDTTANMAPAARDGNTLEADVVAQLQAKNLFLANLVVFKTSDRMTGSLLDVLG